MRTRWLTSTLIAGLVLASAGTASACAGRGERGVAVDRNLITEDEAATVSASTAWEIVSQLRPQFLRGRGRSSARNARSDLPIVYLDNVRLGGTGQLRTIPANVVMSIEFISAPDATTRWGTGHTAGAIDVRTRFRH